MIAAPPLQEFVTANRDEIIRRCLAKVAARSAPLPVADGMNHGVPLFLDQLVETLRVPGTSDVAIGRGAVRHAHDLLLKGFSVSQVVHDYGDVCQSITDLAMEEATPISTADFRTLNACLDDAIAMAVSQYARERDETTAEREALREVERRGFLAHELRNLLNTALLAFDAIRSGRVAPGGSTADVLHRSLMQADALIGRSLTEVRLTQSVQNPERIDVSAFINDVTPAARLATDAAGVPLTIDAGQPNLCVQADRQVLAAVLLNLLQNGVKFTRPGTGIILRVGAGEDRVLIEVEDRCGGLPAGESEDLFRAFEQRGVNRTGLGLGLAFSRWGVEANRGRIYARTIPTVGCVFTIDLPRLHQAAVPSG